MSAPSQNPPLSLQQAFAQAVTLHEQGHLDPAEAAYRRILAGAPDQPDTLHMFGILRIQTGRAQEGFAMIDRALTLRPDFIDAHFNRGVALMQLGRFEEALPSFERAAALHPGHAGAHFNLGVALIELRRPQAALASFDRTVALQPDHDEARISRALTLSKLERWSEALEGFEDALTSRPGDAELLFNRGTALQKLQRLDEALASFSAALDSAPGFAPALVNRGAVLKLLGRPEAALCDYDSVLATEPGHLEALTNRGLALHALGRFDEALASFDQALAVDPGNPLAGFNKSLTLLLTGRFDEGWPLYDQRIDLFGPSAFPRMAASAEPAWNGAETLTGKTLFIYAEQGLGDTIQFCRFASMAAERAAGVVLSVQDPLLPLLRGFDPRVEVIGQGATPRAFDCHGALMSLPGRFGIDAENIPSDGAYLTASADHIAAWAERLGPRRKPRVGVAWSGRAANPEDRARSIALATLAPLLSGQAEWFCLQTDIRDADRTVLTDLPQLTVFDAAELDFLQTAALIANLDLVISVDTSIAHLTAALGRPTWILLPFIPDWRWLLDRNDSPWYRAARLFRQAAPGDWAGVIKDVQLMLAQFD